MQPEIEKSLVNSALALQVLSLIDLTSLNDNDTDESIQALCAKAVTANGHVAAVCVYPRFVALARRLLVNTPVRIATVVNFPQGNDELEPVLQLMTKTISDGADEIDVVFPYRLFLAGDREGAGEFIRSCKTQCGKDILLKVILETGVLSDAQTIMDISDAAITAGADFLKTSTGKVPTGATLEAATVMLSAIKNHSSHVIGFKASGGIRTLAQAAQYIHLAQSIMGDGWISTRTFRFGASQLLDEVLGF